MPEPFEGSYTWLNYLLRPSKQVERKLIVDALHALERRGYPIVDYHYLGLGSPYYADFSLFHKYVGIRDMTCVEHRPIPNRMTFNMPYDFISLHMESVSDVIPRLDRSRPYFVWLDYDVPLSEIILNDVSTAATILAPGSLLLVTVRGELQQAERPATLDDQQARRAELVGELRTWLARLLPYELEPRHLSRKRLSSVFSLALRNQIREQVALRTEPRLSFLQIFNYRYADGAAMLTYGGIIDQPERLAQLVSAGYLDGDFATTSEVPDTIEIPRLTVREKLWLDQNLQRCALYPGSIALELGTEALRSYARFYRHYPTYQETLF